MRRSLTADPRPVFVSGELSGLAGRPQPRDRVTIEVNGVSHAVAVEPRTSLLTLLREGLGLTGTKRGCNRGQCGACTVVMGGRARYACLVLAAESDGTAVRTVEGLADG